MSTERVMATERLVAMFSAQANACARLDSPLYAALLHLAAADVRSGGPCADAVDGYAQARGPDAIALRLLAGVHTLVLTGRAPDLAAYYPSVGGSFNPQHAPACFAAFRAVVSTELARVRDWMTRPPQTNEVGRASVLLCGLLRAARSRPLPIRLFELGASAGLNLRPDRFRYLGDSLDWGATDSPVVLDPAWRGHLPAWLRAAATSHPTLTFAERRGCDLTPINPGSPDGALALKAYIWADHSLRAARLDGALRVAAQVPAQVEARDAAEFSTDIQLQDGTLTVVWHSIMRQYVPASQWALVEAELRRLADASTDRAGFAYLAFEPRKVGEKYRGLLTMRLGRDPEVVLAEAPAHGLPVHDLRPD